MNNEVSQKLFTVLFLIVTVIASAYTLFSTVFTCCATTTDADVFKITKTKVHYSIDGDIEYYTHTIYVKYTVEGKEYSRKIKNVRSELTYGDTIEIDYLNFFPQFISVKSKKLECMFIMWILAFTFFIGMKYGFNSSSSSVWETDYMLNRTSKGKRDIYGSLDSNDENKRFVNYNTNLYRDISNTTDGNECKCEHKEYSNANEVYSIFGYTPKNNSSINNQFTNGQQNGNSFMSSNDEWEEFKKNHQNDGANIYTDFDDYNLNSTYRK